VVSLCEMPSRDMMAAQKDEVNCTPLSDVTWLGTPNRSIHPATNASAHAAAVVAASGNASAHLVDRSTAVKRCVKPSGDVGRGPTMLMWMWENRLVGTAMGCTAAAGCFVILALWQGWHSRHQAVTSAERFGHR
jgi:hypothetical protein